MMKEKLVCLLMLLCSINLFTACSSDDEPAYPIDQEIAGTYKGALNIELGGNNIGKDLPKNVSLTKATDNKINLELKNFSFGATSLGNIVLSNCEVKKNGNTYMFTSSQTLTTLPPAIGNCPITVNGTVTDGKLNVKLVITVSKLGQVVNVVYDGVRLKGNESSEAKIKSFTFDSPIVTEQPVIDEANGTITFKVSEKATDDELKLTPAITVSDKATITPAASVKQDFSGTNSVVYTVVAEDGTIKEYRVSVAGKQAVLKYSFEEWENVPGGFFNEYDKPQPTSELATSAEGAAMLKLMGVTDVPVFKSTDKKSGTYAIKLVTMDTSDKANALVPAITSGSLFTGKFVMGDLENDSKLTFTKFGIPYTHKPLAFKGWYKYTPGAKFIDGSDVKNIVTVPNKIDECSIQAVLYKISNDNETLTGVDINTSDKRVAVAQLSDGTAKAEYTYFNIPFKYLPGKSYEAGAKYKMAIVCSSSKEGDFFKGAGGSTLILDELEIVSE